MVSEESNNKYLLNLQAKSTNKNNSCLFYKRKLHTKGVSHALVNDKCVWELWLGGWANIYKAQFGDNKWKNDYGDDIWLFMKQKSKDGVVFKQSMLWFFLFIFELSFQISSVWSFCMHYKTNNLKVYQVAGDLLIRKWSF
jgi:hypothetical protein